ncbi:MAG: ABC transporter substrate-binding protein [Euryarchaeota archaeon]|nr:ABC transporter substrate-binding protein [Euryarchaeota archaeon]
MGNNKVYSIVIILVVLLAGTAGAMTFINNGSNDDDNDDASAERVFYDSYGLKFVVPMTIETSVVQSGPPMTFLSYLGKGVMDTIIATGNDVKHSGGLNTYNAAYDFTPIATITQNTFTTTEIEKILALNPDIVIVAGGDTLLDTVKSFSDTLNNASVACCVLKRATEVTDDGFKAQFRLMAEVFNVPERAEEVISTGAQYVSDLQEILASVETTEVKHVFAAGLTWGGAGGFYKSTSAYTPFEYLGDKVMNVYSCITDVQNSVLSSEALLNYDANVHSIDMIFIDTGSGYSTTLEQFDGSTNEKAVRALSAFTTREVYSALPWCARGTMPDNSIIIAYQIAALMYPSLFQGFDMDAFAMEVWELFMGFDGAGQTVYDLKMAYVHDTLGADKGLLDRSPLVGP